MDVPTFFEKKNCRMAETNGGKAELDSEEEDDEYVPIDDDEDAAEDDKYEALEGGEDPDDPGAVL
jgi:hypothetical protein